MLISYHFYSWLVLSMFRVNQVYAIFCHFWHFREFLRTESTDATNMYLKLLLCSWWHFIIY